MKTVNLTVLLLTVALLVLLHTYCIKKEKKKEWKHMISIKINKGKMKYLRNKTYTQWKTKIVIKKASILRHFYYEIYVMFYKRKKIPNILLI